MLANALFQNNGEPKSVLLFDDKLKQLYDLYKGQTDDEKYFDSFDDDFLMEFLLTIKATAHLNQKKNCCCYRKKEQLVQVAKPYTCLLK